VADLHAGGAVMWVAGDAIMFGLMMLVFLMWSMDERTVASGRGWFEVARRTSLASLVASHPAPGPAGSAGAAGAGLAAPGGEGTAAPAAPAAVNWDRRGGIDDDEHLAAYNAFLARLNEAESGRKQ
jgi:putative copper resistance protein D